MTRDDWLMMAAYLLGAAVLSWLGPDLWRLPAPLAMTAAFAAAGSFAVIHVLLRVWQQSDLATMKRPESADTRTAKVAAPDALPCQPPDGTGPSVEVREPVVAAAPDNDDVLDVMPVPETPGQLVMQPIVSLHDGRTRHFDACLGEADDMATYIAEVVALAAKMGCAGAGARFFCELNRTSFEDPAFRAELVAVMTATPELAGRIVFEIEADMIPQMGELAADISRLAEAGFEICVKLEDPSQLSESYPGTLRKLDWADSLTLTEGAILAARRCGLSLILTGVNDAISVEAARRLGLSLASGTALGNARTVRLDLSVKQAA